MATNPENLIRFNAEPTPTEEIKHRPAPGGSGKMLAYIDARYVQDRLDEVVGSENWANEFIEVKGGVVCRIGIDIAGSGWVWKSDVGVESNIEATKGNYSDAFKRAAVLWGIARDLYDERSSGGAPQRPAPPSAHAPVVSDWSCPVHHTYRVVPAGVSKSTGKPYSSFVTCSERGCNEKAPKENKVAPRPRPLQFHDDEDI